jgi:N-terminal domain of anti-restriction factor ArdC
MKRDLYAEVSARIVAEFEAGAAPWVKPWSATPGANTPCNAVSNRPYSGCNVVLLWMAQGAGYRTPRFLTFKVQGRGPLLQRGIPRINALVGPSIAARSRFEEPVRLTQLRSRGTDCRTGRRVPVSGIWFRRGNSECGLYGFLD